jgi:hypothetical protein
MIRSLLPNLFSGTSGLKSPVDYLVCCHAPVFSYNFNPVSSVLTPPPLHFFPSPYRTHSGIGQVKVE